jgi:hypothetical protein
LDLDVCVPQWMRDNFNIGIYPTLEERYTFANTACQYVKGQYTEHISKASHEISEKTIIIVSFSFVNEDLRQTFQQSFSDGIIWILIDTDPDTAQHRINNRTNHFYKGQQVLKKEFIANNCDNQNSISIITQQQQQQQPPPLKASSKDDNNSDWDFAPVTFQHYFKLNGLDPVENNACKVTQIIIGNQ